jgi:hypothetical protein
VRRVATYVAAALLLIAILTGLLWPWVGVEARRGLATAAVLALVFQAAAFGLLVWVGRWPQGFLLGLAGGMLARMGLVGAVAVVVSATDVSRPRTVATVLGLVGYLFVLVLLEAWFIQDRTESTRGAERTS